jgi:hypothetical protein
MIPQSSAQIQRDDGKGLSEVKASLPECRCVC